MEECGVFRESFRRSTTSLSDDDRLSHSSRREDEEEALKWAAIERLPTFERLRRGVLKEKGGEIKEITIEGLGQEERKMLLERLIGAAEEDNEKFLWKLKNRMERVGIESPTIQVRYENLCVRSDVYVGGREVPTILNAFINKIEEVLNLFHILPSRKRPITILHNMNGIIKPSRMTLLLGPPGSGKTTFLLALSGKLDSSLKVSGRVTYNGHEMSEFVPQKSSAYISQTDVHMGQMTVRETLAFSAICQGSGSCYAMLMELAKREKAANIKPDPDVDLFMKAAALNGQADLVVDYILKILGLEICADMMVGDQMTRGISGGERKRLTTGEMLVGPAKALFMDEISNGLDSSTTYRIIRALRQSIHVLNGTALISLLQPAPETYELFDDIILLSEGQIVYQGPRENVVQFFKSMGFKCPERKGVADFLQEVTSKKDQEQYWAKTEVPYRFISVKEFADAFQLFHVGQTLKDELDTPFDKNKSHPSALTTKKYGAKKLEMLKACLSREFLLMRRNSSVYILMFIMHLFTGLVAMTVFLRVKMNHNTIEDAGVYLGALFYGVLGHLFNGVSDLAMTLERLTVFYKQRDLQFYPGWAYAIPAWILKIPISIVESALWTTVTYYVMGFDPNIGRMFGQCLIFILVSQVSFGLYRFLAALGRDADIANLFAGLSYIVLIVLGGVIVSRKNIGDSWIWGYWASPLMYAQNAVAVNEFLGNSWKKMVEEKTYSETLGVMFLKSRGLVPHGYWYWIGVGILLGYTFLLNGLYATALTFLDPLSKGHAILSEETYINKEVKKITKKTEQSSKGNIVSLQSALQGPIIPKDEKRSGMILPFTPLSITFENIKYSVDMPAEMKAQGIKEDRLLILNDLNGTFRPGVLTALMGVSGAGKTTLLDVLAGRKTGDYIEGSITIAGYPKKQETFARISGYCEQFDIHSPHITVYESLLFSAWLRLPSEVDSATRKMFIDEVLDLVELSSLRRSMVGLPGISGLSTEQRKRLTVAVELIANPSIIFTDEPTSGLDARAAAIVMRTVRNTVDTGRTVVCTIHQPSIDIFESFDELFLMKQGGEEIYVGPLGRYSGQLIDYLEGINGTPRIKDGCNPATWMLEVTSRVQEESLGINFTDIYKKSDLFRRNKAVIRELSQPSSVSQDLHFATRYSQPFFVQFVACLWKQHKSYWHYPAYNSTKILFMIVASLLFGTIFWGLGSKLSTRQELFNVMGAIFAGAVLMGGHNSFMVQPVVHVERMAFYREEAAWMYSPLAYAFGQVMIEVPYVLLQSIIYSAIVYSMIGFEWKIAKFFLFLFFVFATFLYYTYSGMMAVGLTPNVTMASILVIMFLKMWNLFQGFVIPQPRIPIWWRWYHWACPVSWSLHGIFTSLFGDVRDGIDTGESVEAFLRRYYGYKHEFLGIAVAAVIGFNVLFASVFAYSIKNLNFQRR